MFKMSRIAKSEYKPPPTAFDGQLIFGFKIHLSSSESEFSSSNRRSNSLFQSFQQKTRLKLKFSIFASESSRRRRDSESKNCVILFRHVYMSHLSRLRTAKNNPNVFKKLNNFSQIAKMVLHQKLAPGQRMHRKFWIIGARPQFVQIY